MSQYDRQAALRLRKKDSGHQIIRPTVTGETYDLLKELAPQFGSYGSIIDYAVAEYAIAQGIGASMSPVSVHGQFMLSRHAMTILMTVRKDTGKNFDEIIEGALQLLMDHGLPGG